MKPTISNPTNLTYIDGEPEYPVEGYGICVSDPALAWRCESEVEAYRAAIRTVGLIRTELMAKLEALNGEIYRDD